MFIFVIGDLQLFYALMVAAGKYCYFIWWWKIYRLWESLLGQLYYSLPLYRLYLSLLSNNYFHQFIPWFHTITKINVMFFGQHAICYSHLAIKEVTKFRRNRTRTTKTILKIPKILKLPLADKSKANDDLK